MKISSYIITLVILFSLFSTKNNNALEKHIVVVIASYNNKDWYKKNLDSVFCQQYRNYHIIYIDDNSSDGTGKLVKKYILEKGQISRTILICNKNRQGALANQYKAIHSCNDHDIIIIVDGDDWLAHDDVFTKVNEVYSDNNVWLTYGQFQSYPSDNIGFCCPFPKEIITRNAFRNFINIPSHLRTFYAGLFKKIRIKDLLYKGNFFTMTGDIAAMFPMIEMARDHFKFIPDVLYIYNEATPINDHKVSKQLQRQLDLEIRQRKRYKKIDSPFSS